MSNVAPNSGRADHLLALAAATQLAEESREASGRIAAIGISSLRIEEVVMALPAGLLKLMGEKTPTVFNGVLGAATEPVTKPEAAKSDATINAGPTRENPGQKRSGPAPTLNA